MEGGGDVEGKGTVTCAKWIQRPKNEHLAVIGKSQPSSIEVLSFDPKANSLSSPKGKYEFEEGGVNPVTIAVHPSGDHFVCDCKLFNLCCHEDKIELKTEELVALQGVGLQKCSSFSVDGTKFATGGVDGRLRIFEWPSMRVILDEPKAHKSFQDMDFSLDSAFLASTSTDGSARVWNTTDGAPITTLTRNSDEKIGFCRFSKDGMKPFLFCSVQRGNTPLTVVWEISTWQKLGTSGYLESQPQSCLLVWMANILLWGSKDGDMCVVEVKTMQVRHSSKRLHLGSNIKSLEFCPSERLVLSTSAEWGATVTKLTVPADWKEWQIYLFLLGLFLGSIVVFFILYEISDSFWNFPQPNDRTISSNVETILRNEQSDQGMWENSEL